MPIEIPAGESVQFDIGVSANFAGSDTIDFDLYVDERDVLHTIPIHQSITVIQSDGPTNLEDE